MDFSVAALVGTVAGICSTGSFIPQVVKVWRDKDTGAISKKMYLVTVAAFSLWIVYGAMIGSVPIIVFNAASLSASILVVKLRNSRQARTAAGNGSAT
jgi:MtN3 and saliva related transmembrane protein